MGLTASATLQDDHRDDGRRGGDNDQRRYYDRNHKDYHVWDNHEDGVYRAWLSDRHEVYRDFSKQKRSRQVEYWKYRHEQRDDAR
ncbi:MAG TPA: hypothetical protein VKZ53_24190 [Candidatus Angelobacter sp.]|nr:hypothetical protein [Candidatus Angelobacter sp.]